MAIGMEPHLMHVHGGLGVGVAHVLCGQDCRCSARMQIAMLRHMDADCNAKACVIRYMDAASLLLDQPVWRQS